MFCKSNRREKDWNLIKNASALHCIFYGRKIMKKMNVVFILSDDQGAWALGCANNPEILTPNLDRLAHEGILFENFFCASPVCSPARASLLTGKIPSQHGVHDWLIDDPQDAKEIEYLEGHLAYTDILNDCGYICGLSGKWHLGKSSTPQKGFKHWFAHKSGGGPYYNAPIYKDNVLIHDPRYVSDVITEDAISFIESVQDQPFYLQVGFTAPHAPWINNHPKQYTELYEDCLFKTCQMGEKHPDAIYLTDEVLNDERANQIGYYAAITAMDANIGKIIDKLEELNLRENTLIVFTSDNGFSCGQHGFWGKGNGTFPINLYDTSLKVPFIISQPSTIKQNVRCDSLVSAYDFMPTLLEYLEIDYLDTTLPGKSFASLLTGDNQEINDDVVIMDEYGPNRAIRSKQYKYICRYPYGPDEFYDLTCDWDELHNCIDEEKYQKIIEEYRYRLDSWFLKYANPAIDGSKERVYGCGQQALAGIHAKGKTPYALDDYIRKTKTYQIMNERK